MGWKLENSQIFMHRPNLINLPSVELDSEFCECQCTNEMLPMWVDFLNEVFGSYTLDSVKSQIEDRRWDNNRLKLIFTGKKVVALSMAWYEPELWPKSGFIFWVAVAEEHRRKGLGSFVLNRALEQLAQDGFRDAVVYTQEFRLPAVQMYMNHGFKPLITGTVIDERERWERTFKQLGKPELREMIHPHYRDIAEDKLSNSEIVINDI